MLINWFSVGYTIESGDSNAFGHQSENLGLPDQFRDFNAQMLEIFIVLVCRDDSLNNFSGNCTRSEEVSSQEKANHSYDSSD